MSKEKNKKITILIAEDDKLILNAMRDGLERAGFDVHVAHDGIEALKLSKNICPCIILLDIAMPEKDGLAVLKEIRANKKTKILMCWFFQTWKTKKPSTAPANWELTNISSKLTSQSRI